MLFFELLQVALGNRERLSCTPSFEEWLDLYDESERQAVTGILLYAINRLPAGQRPPQEVLFQWIGVGQIIEQQNHVMDEHCKELLRKLNDEGIDSTILKGQGVAQLYDKELRSLRQSGDIDVYANCGIKKALALTQSLGLKDVKWDYKHLHLNIWDDTEIEMHYRVEVLLNLWKNRKLQKWFKNHTGEIFSYTENTENTERLVTPTLEFNVFYILLHIYRHFLYEGVGMRQIVDYYFVLKNLNANDNSNTNHTNRANFAIEAVKKFGMERFAKGLMWMMHEALGMPREWMLWGADEKEGQYILNEVMAGGNFGHHDMRLQHGGGKWNTVKQVCRHNWHLLSHYPADVIWAPVWFVWHKCWKLAHKMKSES